MSFNFEKQTLNDLAKGLKSGEFSAVELAKHCIQEIDGKDDKIKAFLRLSREKLLADAAASDERRAKGNILSDYDGIPVGIKDCIVVKDEFCSSASKLLENVKSPYDSTAAAKLKAKGFIPFGRLNMDEFAMGSSCENSAFQKTANPRDLSRVPGGSSGGSAAAVAAGFAPAALGSDTGGSIRQPASFCGIVGVKPTYGRVSRFGLIAFASSLDQIGPMTNHVEDSAILLDAISGRDDRDASCLPLESTQCAAAINALNGSLKGVKVGLPKEYLNNDGIAPGVSEVLRKNVELVKALGGELVDVSLPHTKYAVAVYYILATAEASANLARFDGVRYGARKDTGDLISTYFATRGAGFGEEVKRRILLGTYVLSSGYYDAYYLRAQKVRTLIRRDFEEAFQKCDVMLTPVTPDVAFRFGAKSDPLQMYLSDIFTIALNLAGNCGISLPGGIDAASGMPVGMQILAPALAEDRMFQIARAMEMAHQA